MARRRVFDLPLDADPATRFLPWLIAIMVYLASLALAVMLVLWSGVERWAGGLDGTVTVQVIPRAGTDEDQRVAAVLAVLHATPGIAAAEPLAPDKAAALVEPWLGREVDLSELPLPRLVEARLDPAAPADLGGLKARLAERDPGAILDDHQDWVARLAGFVLALEGTAAAVVVLVLLAAVATVVFATRAGLAMHTGIIEVLHLIGAKDDYIARQFQAHALRLGLWGGLMGLVPAALTLAGLAWAAEALAETRLLPGGRLGFLPLAILAALPAVAAIIAMMTARMTVLRTLARLP